MRGDALSFTFTDIVNKLKALADADGVLPALSNTELRRYKAWLDRHGYDYIQVLDDAGLRPRTSLRLDYDGLIFALRDLARDMGHLPAAEEMHKTGLLYVVYKYHNSLDDAARAAGVDSRRMYLRKKRDRALDDGGENGRTD